MSFKILKITCNQIVSHDNIGAALTAKKKDLQPS
jgi:hypothetical protein